LGLAGHKITYLTNVVPILVMVIAFCDSMHLTSALQQRLRRGAPPADALRGSILEIGPACVLTSLTTCIAMLSLAFAGSSYLAEFGIAAGLSILAAYVSVIAVTPILFSLLYRPKSRNALPAVAYDGRSMAVDRIVQSTARFSARWPRGIAVGGLLLLIVAGLLYFQTEPRYQYRQLLPQNNPAYRALEQIDRDLGGTTQVQVLLSWTPATDLRQVVRGVRAAHRSLAADPAINAVWSIDIFAAYFDPSGAATSAVMARRLAELPEGVAGRFFLPRRRLAMISAFAHGNRPVQANALFDRLDGILARLGRTHPGVTFALTGLPVLAARQSETTINEMRWALMAAIGLVIVLIGVAFRSCRFALVSIPPNLFPIAIAGAALFLTGSDLQYTSILAMTVAFGIAVDDTIHFLNAVRLQNQAESSEAAALVPAMRAVGPVLIATTAILIAGLGLVFLSEMPTIKLFGLMAILVLVVALVADLLFLPALMRATARRQEAER
jgi:predicted RND superfamily exporter protein